VAEWSPPERTIPKKAGPRPTPFRRTRLALVVVRIYATARWLVLRRGAVEAVPLLRLGLSDHTTPECEKRHSLRLGLAVVRVLRYVPADSRCLMRSLVLTGLLARRGVYAKVVIGVRPAPSFGAHAWVEVDGVALLPTNEPEFHRLVEI
jgi:hypothetical protein